MSDTTPHTPATPDDAGDGIDPAAEPQPETGELRRALEERDAKYLRLAADFENFRRRAAQESIDRSRYGAETAAVSLLPVLDNLQRAIQHAPEGDPMVDGVRMVARQFEDALRSIGVTPIDAEGQPFDPALHEAIGGEESPEVDRDTVVAVLQPGYRLHDRVLRPALVRVAHPVAG
ncbi:MAG TPA: nucleotide exchange factor GrpE [Candidatus Angelobacter sp.]|jgi:molecular chaperone GrpE|nr:nucleotide exchange factor GrpE [Candidatus Angelobacter sp.]